ncbi:MAG: 4-hydroxy-3-methylbut-2-enyl diphosphate reductase [Pseudomonadota bacterium]|jgi:4-hydroxy-3-methylbut-2-enyl diphosphate reductase
MPKQFDIPRAYRSDIIGAIKKKRAETDGRKEDLSATEIDLGPVVFRIARFFGFCYGVENAIEIAYRALEENPGKRIFLLSEMIHNPHVNQDLISRGVSFLQTAEGEQLIPFSELCKDDVVIVPAFGTTREIFQELQACGVDPQSYNATCPFVEKVWKRGRQLAKQGYSIVIHGKHTHEETRATFSQIRLDGPSVVVRDREEAKLLARYVRGDKLHQSFFSDFQGRFSDGFRVPEDLVRLGVVNQTTMLAEETHEIAQMMRQALIDRYGEGAIGEHFADTRDTLCYATSENQRSMRALLEHSADLAVVVGGYNSSNTSHLVELCEGLVPVFYVEDADEILSRDEIRHLDLHRGVTVTRDWLPNKAKVEILISAGASCPDAMVEAVLARIASLFPGSRALKAPAV